MSDHAVTLRPARGDALATVEARLERADLPTADLRDEETRLYLVECDGERVGVGGLEIYGSNGLVRSVAVDPDHRGEGYGTAIVRALESEAREAGVERCYLLTTTAAEFFAGLGYEEVDRAAAPDAIRETAEFASLCPSAATAMRRQL